MGEWGWPERGPEVSSRASEEVQAEAQGAPGTAPPTPCQEGMSKCKGSG